MLDIAIKYEEELKYLFRNLWFQDKYKYYNYSIYFSDFEIDKDSWNRHQFVSLDKDGSIIGCICYDIDRETNSAKNLNIVNFTDNAKIFGIDLKRAIIDIFEKFKFNKLRFTVVIGNPVEESYDKLVNTYGGRIVGLYKYEAKLFDGSLRDVKLYEITKDEYNAAKAERIRSF